MTNLITRVAQSQETIRSGGFGGIVPTLVGSSINTSNTSLRIGNVVNSFSTSTNNFIINSFGGSLKNNLQLPSSIMTNAFFARKRLINKHFILYLILFILISCNTNKSIFNIEYKLNPKMSNEKIEAYKKIDTSFIYSTTFLVENINKKDLKFISIIDINSGLDLFKDGLGKYQYYQNSDIYYIILNKEKNYCLNVYNEKFLIDKNKLKKYYYLTLTYNLKKYNLKFSNIKKGYY